MSKSRVILAVIFVVVAITVGVIIWRAVSNRGLVDATWHFDTGYVMLPDGEYVVGNVVSWTDFDDGMIQVRINNITYFTHSSNVVLTHNH